MSDLDLDLDLNTPAAPPATPDARDRMAMQLMSRGHATVDEVMHASYGTWPPRGLEIIGTNNARINFVELSTMIGTTDPNQILEASSALGRGTIQGPRQVWVNPTAFDPQSGRVGDHQVSSVVGHEGVHILQGDHYQRALDTFGQRSGIQILNAQTNNISNLVAQSVFSRHTDPQRFDEIANLHKIDYLREGIEIQARVHQIMIDGYQKWGQMPQTSEQFLIAMHGAGVKLSPEVLADLEHSPTYAENKKIFTAVPHAVADDINHARSTLTDVGQRIFERDSLTRMYGDLIEMYGDRLGRERFGQGTNEFGQARAARAAGVEVMAAPLKIRFPVPDFEVTPRGGDKGVGISLSRMDGEKAAMLKAAMQAQNIRFEIEGEGTKRETLVVRQADLDKLTELKRHALNTTALNSAAHPGRHFITEMETTPGRDGKNYIFLDNLDGKQKLALVETLKREGIIYGFEDASGRRALVMSEADNHKFNALKAEIQLGRPILGDPTSTDYHLRVAQADTQSQLADPTFRPPSSPQYNTPPPPLPPGTAPRVDIDLGHADLRAPPGGTTYPPKPPPPVAVVTPTPVDPHKPVPVLPNSPSGARPAIPQFDLKPGAANSVYISIEGMNPRAIVNLQATLNAQGIPFKADPIETPNGKITIEAAHVDKITELKRQSLGGGAVVAPVSHPNPAAPPAPVQPAAPVPPPPPAPVAAVPPPPPPPPPVPGKVDINLAVMGGSQVVPPPRPSPPPPPVAPPPKVDIDLSAPAASSSGALRATGGKVDQHTGRAGTAVRAAEQVAQGNYTEAAAGVAQEVAVASGLKTGVRFAAQRIPVAGAIVTAGMTLWTAGAEAAQGNFGRAASELGAGTAESIGNIVGFGAGDALRETFRAAVVVTAGDKYAPEKSGVRQIAETSINMGNKAILDSRYGSMNKKDLGAAILKDPTLPDTVKLNGKDVSLLVALEDKAYRDTMLKNLQAAAAKGHDMSAQIAMVSAYDKKIDVPVYTYTNMSKSALEKALIKDPILPDTVKIGGKDVSLVTALGDQAFREAFIKNMTDLAAKGQDVAVQIAMLKAYDIKLKPIEPTVAATSDFMPII